MRVLEQKQIDKMAMLKDRGLTNKIIASRFGVSKDTVRRALLDAKGK